ncbi:hypothetical protein D770_16565 [Flammeovirgaceae bacterium 311]|nr:hypothetical protein D770_16565 [Flammeovirgaceae bacterium 311]
MPAKTFLTAEWRKLIMANYAVNPKLLEPYLPYGTELDLWQGQCYVSLVGFLFQKVRLKGIPVPFHTTFPEVNLRFYVRFKSGEGWRRGVVFIKEIVPRPALTLVARTFYGEPYQTMPMQYCLEEKSDLLQASYSWKYQRWHHLSVAAKNKASAIEKGSEAEFITEHYWGYTKRGEQHTSEYEVVHPVWEQYPVTAHDIDADFGLLYGQQFNFLTNTKPNSIILAEGSPIAVRMGLKV